MFDGLMRYCCRDGSNKQSEQGQQQKQRQQKKRQQHQQRVGENTHVRRCSFPNFAKQIKK
jgi:hypothetical protein